MLPPTQTRFIAKSLDDIQMDNLMVWSGISTLTKALIEAIKINVVINTTTELRQNIQDFTTPSTIQESFFLMLPPLRIGSFLALYGLYL